MLVGIAVGPGLGLVSAATFGSIGPVLATITLAAILFESGTSLDLQVVAQSARSTVSVTLATAAATAAIVALVAALMGGLPWPSAALLGVIVSGTSSAVVIPMVAALKMEPRAGTVLILESALTDVLSIVLAVALLAAQSEATLSVGVVVGRTLSSLLFATAIGMAGAAVWLRIWNWVRAFPATIFATLAWALVLYGLAELLGFSGAIAVLSLGFSLRNHEALNLKRVFNVAGFSGISELENRFYREVVFLLKTFFFVYLGISMRFDDPRTFGIAAVALAGVYVARGIAVQLLLPRSSRRGDMAVASVMVPKGLAAAVLAGLPLQAGVPGGDTIRSVTYAMVLVSITATALAAGFVGTRPARPVVARLFSRFAE